MRTKGRKQSSNIEDRRSSTKSKQPSYFTPLVTRAEVLGKVVKYGSSPIRRDTSISRQVDGYVSAYKRTTGPISRKKRK